MHRVTTERREREAIARSERSERRRGERERTREKKKKKKKKKREREKERGRGPFVKFSGRSISSLSLIMKSLISVALLALLAQAAAERGVDKIVGGLGAIAVEGFGVVDTQQRKEESKATLEDVGAVAARLAGIELPLAVDATDGDSEQVSLPTGDVFSPPKNVVVVLVDGVSVQEVAAQPVDEVPLLHRLFVGAGAKPVAIAQNGEASHRQVLASLLSVGAEISPDTVGADTEMSQLEQFSKTAIARGATVVVLRVQSLRVAKDQALALGLQSLDSSISRAVSLLGSETATQVVLLGDQPLRDADLVLLGRRNLDDKNGSKDGTEASLVFYEQSLNEGFLIEVWTAVILILFVMLLFCCVQWADELDPMLYASLPKEDKED